MYAHACTHTHTQATHSCARTQTHARTTARTHPHAHVPTYARRRRALRCVRERDRPQVHAAPLGRCHRARGRSGGAARARRRLERDRQARVRRPIAILGNGRRAPRRPWPAGTGPMQCGAGRTDGHTRDSLTRTSASIWRCACGSTSTPILAHKGTHMYTREAMELRMFAADGRTHSACTLVWMDACLCACMGVSSYAHARACAHI
jgi:hypothetical protein